MGGGGGALRATSALSSDHNAPEMYAINSYAQILSNLANTSLKLKISFIKAEDNFTISLHLLQRYVSVSVRKVNLTKRDR